MLLLLKLLPDSLQVRFAPYLHLCTPPGLIDFFRDLIRCEEPFDRSIEICHRGKTAGTHAAHRFHRKELILCHGLIVMHAKVALHPPEVLFCSLYMAGSAGTD